MDKRYYPITPFTIIVCGTLVVCKAIEWLVLMIIG